MNQNDVKSVNMYKRWILFFWGSWKYERNGSRAKLTWRPSGITYFARDPLRSYFHEPQENEIYFLNELIEQITWPSDAIGKQIWQIVRLFHGCEVLIEKSARGSLFAKQWSPGTDFSIHTKQPW